MGEYLLPYARLRLVWNGFSVHVLSVRHWLLWLMESYLAKDAGNAKVSFQGKNATLYCETYQHK